MRAARHSVYIGWVGPSKLLRRDGKKRCRGTFEEAEGIVERMARPAIPTEVPMPCKTVKKGDNRVKNKKKWR